MKPKFVKYYMEIAELTAKLSYAVRLNVGAVIVKGNQILASGFNGMPSGWENVCEEKQWLESDAGMWLDAEDIEEEWPFKEYRPDAGRQGCSKQRKHTGCYTVRYPLALLRVC
jgi:deoxycytidylate deaminase